jgi:hypothetical protein
MSKKTRLIGAVALAAELAIPACYRQSAPQTAPLSEPALPLRCDLGVHAWLETQTPQSSCVSSSWRFTPRSDGLWNAMEFGCANATGIAAYDGKMVTLLFISGGVYSGVYTWPLDGRCQGSLGKVWHIAGLIGPSTLSISGG